MRGERKCKVILLNGRSLATSLHSKLLVEDVEKDAAEMCELAIADMQYFRLAFIEGG